MHAVLKLMYKYITKNKARCLLIGFCIMMSSALIFFLQLEVKDYNSVRKKMNIDDQGGKRTCSVYTDNKEYINNLKNIDIVKNMSIVLNLQKYFNLNNYDNKIEIVGFQDNVCELLNFKLCEGKFPKGTNEIALEKWIVDNMKPVAKIGDKVKVKFKDFEHEFILVGTYDYIFNINQNKNSGIGYITLENAEEIYTNLLNKNDKPLYECLIETTITSDQIIASKLDYKGVFMQLDGTYGAEIVQKIQASNKKVCNIMSLIIIILSALVLYNIINSSVGIKSQEFGMLKAMGMTDKELVELIVGEGIILGIVFTGVGIVLGKLGYEIVAKILDVEKSVYINTNIALREITYTYVFCLPMIILSTFFSIRNLLGESAITLIRGENYLKTSEFNKNFEIDVSSQLKKFIFGFAKCNVNRNKYKFKIAVRTIYINIILMIAIFYLQIHIGAKIEKHYDFIIENSSKEINNLLGDKEIKAILNISGVKNILPEKVFCQFINMSRSVDKLGINGIGYIEEVLKFDTLENANEYRKNNYYYMVTQIKEYRMEDIEKLKGMVSKGEIDNNEIQSEPVCILIQNINDEKITKYKVGDKISISANPCIMTNGSWTFPTEIELTIAAILDEDEYKGDGRINTVAIISDSVGHKYLNKPGYYKRYDTDIIKIDIENKMYFDKVKLELEKVISDNRNLRLLTSDDKNVYMIMKRKRVSIQFLCLATAMSICGILSIFCIMFINIVLRKKEYALLKAVGMSNKQLNKLVIFESFLYGFEGVKIGVIIGSICVFFLYLFIKSQTEIICIYPIKFVLIIILCVFVACFLAALNALRVINKDEITTAIQAVE